MTTSTRPQTHDERGETLRAVDALRTNPATDPALLTLEERILTPSRLGYVSTLALFGQTKVTWRLSSEALEAADVVFDPVFGRWYRSCRDAEGRILTAELKNALGVLPSDLIEKTEAEEVRRCQQLFAHQAERPELRGDPTLLEELRQAVARLGDAVQADEQATRAKLEAGSQLALATTAYDRAYGSFVKAVRSLVGEEQLRGLLPRFVRRSNGSGAGGADGTP